MKLLTIFIYTVAVVAFSWVIFEFADSGRRGRVGGSEIENAVLSIYRNIDRGNFLQVYRRSAEGKWKPENTGYGEKRSYCLTGLVGKEQFIENAIRDYGEGGWRIRFNSLNVTGVRKLSSKQFETRFPREGKILEYMDVDIHTVYIVALKGYNIGSCDISDWEKKLPVVWTSGGWKAVVAGTPEDLAPLHRELWLTDIAFDVSKENSYKE